ncbi:MAG: class I SAM-dependent methyltransferase [Bacteroidia bacterium]|nr:class I SAM-dependent methyltransferase [Bacteroidia bacterium]
MKIHKVLVEAVVHALDLIFVEKKQADKVVANVLKSNAKWGARDRNFIAENVYEIVRWWRKIIFCADIQEDKVSSNNLWQIVGVWLVMKGGDCPAWNEFEQIDVTSINTRIKQVGEKFAIAQSYPDWLVNELADELPETWEQELLALNQPADIVLRVNTLKTTKEQVLSDLNRNNIPCAEVVNLPDAIKLLKRINIRSTELYKTGKIEIQDASSQLVAPYLGVLPGMTVIDTCAGAGGKSLHLAAQMKNMGKIIAMDTEEWKLEELRNRAKRAGISIIETQLITNDSLAQYHQIADCVLMDVPCSGLGVIKRKPDTKWKLNKEFLTTIQQKQAELLQAYSQFVKHNGKIVYATCSILPSENHLQVNRFLTENSTFSLIKSKYISPAETGFDGFYMALMQQKS